jgi:LPS-assembly lipoprotein
MTTSIRNQFLMMLAIISLIACGFQLRGGIEANFDSISINGGSAGFVKQLKKRLRQSSIAVLPTDGEVKLEIVDDLLNKRILSLNSDGRISEYELNYKVSYRVKGKNDSEWGQLINNEVRRQYTYDDENVVAKALEEEKLINGMRDELIRTITAQISLQKV